MIDDKIRKEIRNLTGGLSQLQSKIILLRGYIPEEELLYQRQFSEQLKRPLTTINYNVKILRKKGFFTKLNFLTPDGKVVFQKLKGYLDDTRKLRGHKIFGAFLLLEPYKNFEAVRDKYTKISSSPKHSGFRIDFKDCLVLFYSPNKVLFYLPKIYGDDISESYIELWEKYLSPLKNYLEQEFPGLKINPYNLASIHINHFAYQNHPIAEAFKQANEQYSSDRIEIDHSHGVAELETVHKKHSVEDMDKILDYENLIRGSKTEKPDDSGKNKRSPSII